MSTFRRRLMMQGKKAIKPYMYFEALQNGLTISLSTNAIEYSLDCNTWVTLPAGASSPAINTGEKIYFKGELTPATDVGIGTFTLSKRCNAGGNAMSLLFGDDFENQYSLSGKNYAFYRLFLRCTTLESVSDGFLPATTLANNCYANMFYGCSSLKSVPELLPATTLANYCYNYMFGFCYALTTAPVLPAITLVTHCYTSMFYNCTRLNYIKALFTTTPGSDYTFYWVSYVASSGTFVKNKDATWNVTGASGIPSGWTVITE